MDQGRLSFLTLFENVFAALKSLPFREPLSLWRSSQYIGSRHKDDGGALHCFAACSQLGFSRRRRTEGPRSPVAAASEIEAVCAQSALSTIPFGVRWDGGWATKQSQERWQGNTYDHQPNPVKKPLRGSGCSFKTLHRTDSLLRTGSGI